MDGQPRAGAGARANGANHVRQLMWTVAAAKLARGEYAPARPRQEIARLVVCRRPGTDLNRRLRIDQAFDDGLAQPRPMPGRLSEMVAPGVAVSIEVHQRKPPTGD